MIFLVPQLSKFDPKRLNDEYLSNPGLKQDYKHFMETYVPGMERMTIPPLKGFPREQSELILLKLTYERSKVEYLKNLGPKGVADLPVKLKINAKSITLTKDLGSGAFGRVYEASIDRSRTPVVVKIAHSGIKNEDDIFKREVEVLQQLRRLQVADFENKIIVQTKIKGITLENYLKTSDRIETFLDPDSKIFINYKNLHNQFYKETNYKFIHGDIRPANVIVGNDGSLTLIDFGLSKKASSDIFNAQKQLDADHLKAMDELKLSFLNARLSLFKKQPNSDIKTVVETWVDYIDLLKKTGRKEAGTMQTEALKIWMASAWPNFI